MPILTLPENVVCIDDSDLALKDLIPILAAISQQPTALSQFKSESIPVFVAGHLRRFKQGKSDIPSDPQEGDTIDKVLLEALKIESREYQRLLLKLTRSKHTALKPNQQPMAIISHNEGLEETPLLTFVYHHASYTIRWSKETLKAKYASIKDSDSHALTLMLGDDAFSILKAPESCEAMVDFLKRLSQESSPEKVASVIIHTSKYGVHHEASRIGLFLGIACGIVGVSLTPVVFTALYPALLSAAASGIITATLALLSLVAAAALIPTSHKYAKLSNRYQLAATNIQNNTSTNSMEI